MITSIFDSKHPDYLSDMPYWNKYRETYEGGESYRDKYLEHYSDKESNEAFLRRRRMTPIETFAKNAVDDIRNSISMKMPDVSRIGGDISYQKAISGLDGGVDNKGNNMNTFIGDTALTELLVMGRVGIFVDMPNVSGLTLSQATQVHPYAYVYKVEDILSWSYQKPEDPGEFKSLLLRDYSMDYTIDNDSGVVLPSGDRLERYRLMWICPDDGRVCVQFFDKENDELSPITKLNLTRIPFIMPSIKGSIIKDVCSHQIALMNLASSSVSYGININFPIYTEQRDVRVFGAHLKGPDTTTSTGGPNSQNPSMETGPSDGLYYQPNTDRPDFISPPAEALEANLKLQDKLEDDIRKLVNLAVMNQRGERSTAKEDKGISDQGIEAGLAYVGSVLESTERKISELWGNYVNQDSAMVSYPSRYTVKSTKDRLGEAKDLKELMITLPGTTIKKEVAKDIAAALIGHRTSADTMGKIYSEIDSAPYSTSDPDIISKSIEDGMCSKRVGSMALGFSPSVYKEADKEYTERLIRIKESQSDGEIENPAARGLNDLEGDKSSAKAEKDQSQNPDLTEDGKKPVRGEGKNNKDDA